MIHKVWLPSNLATKQACNKSMPPHNFAQGSSVPIYMQSNLHHHIPRLVQTTKPINQSASVSYVLLKGSTLLHVLLKEAAFSFDVKCLLGKAEKELSDWWQNNTCNKNYIKIKNSIMARQRWMEKLDILYTLRLAHNRIHNAENKSKQWPFPFLGISGRTFPAPPNVMPIAQSIWETKLPQLELYKVVFTENKVRQTGGRVCISVMVLLLFILKVWAANNTNCTDLIQNLP